MYINISLIHGFYLCSYMVTTIRMTKFTSCIQAVTPVKSKQTIYLNHCPCSCSSVVLTTTDMTRFASIILCILSPSPHRGSVGSIPGQYMGFVARSFALR